MFRSLIAPCGAVSNLIERRSLSSPRGDDGPTNSHELIGGLALAQARLDRFEIVLDVGVAGVAGLRLQQRLAGAARVAAQYVGVAAVVEDLRRGACDLGGLVVGAVGEIEAALAVVRRRQAHPRLEVARMQLDRAAEVAFGQAEIAGLEVLLAEAEIVVGQSLRRGGGRRVARGRPHAAGRSRIVLDRGARVGLRLEQIAKSRRALAAVEP